VTLKVGRALSGVVTCDKVFERREGASWVPADKDAPGAGVRLFFVKDSDGFVFVPTKDMKSAEKLDEVTDREGRDLAKRRADAARRAEDERVRLREKRAEAAAAAAAANAPTEAEETPKAEEHEVPVAVSPEEQLARYTTLLTKYPPEKWTPETPKEIEKRRIVMDLFPSDEEKAFLAVFEEWSKAYAAWKAGQDAAKAAAESAKK
jgi:hypothetical protein